jgi:hypothetical protein
MAPHELLTVIEDQVTTLLSSSWRILSDACADRELRYPGVYLLAYSERQLTGMRVEVEDVFYVGMSTALNGVLQRIRQFRDGVERNDHHSGARRFFREYSGNLPFSKLRTNKRFYTATLVTECGRQNASDWRSMGCVACLEYYVVARVLEKTGKLPPLNLAKPTRRNGGRQTPVSDAA